jgi:signal transduction histidine kinase
MNGILGFAELLKSEETDEKIREDYINVIINSGQQLLSIINDVLEISRIETGQVKVEKEKVQINDLLREMELFFQPLIPHNHNKLIISTPNNSSEVYFIGDQSKVKQVLTNLINNALKFTLNGTVRVGYEILNDEFKFFVSDTGIGIPEEYLDKIFDRFLQAKYENQVKQRGTGLGLAICQKLVNLMQGEIWVETEVNKGSTFYFTLPK